MASRWETLKTLYPALGLMAAGTTLLLQPVTLWVVVTSAWELGVPVTISTEAFVVLVLVYVAIGCTLAGLSFSIAFASLFHPDFKNQSRVERGLMRFVVVMDVAVFLTVVGIFVFFGVVASLR